MSVVAFRSTDCSFNPETADAMSEAFRIVCEKREIVDAQGREHVALRVISYAGAGVRSADELAELVLLETSAA